MQRSLLATWLLLALVLAWGVSTGYSQQARPRILISSSPPLRGYFSLSKLAGLALRQGYRADLGEETPGAEYAGFFFAYPSPEQMDSLYSVLRKGGRAVVFQDSSTGNKQLNDVMQDRFEMTDARERFPMLKSSFACVAMWRGAEILAPGGAFSAYFIPGPDYTACNTHSSQSGRERCVAASRPVGKGEVWFLQAPINIDGKSVIPFEDARIELGDNERAAISMLNWLAHR